MNPAIVAGAVAAFGALAVLATGLRVIGEYERGVVLRLGRRGPLLDPGPRLILPLGIDRLIRVDMRSSVLEIPVHDVITADGVPVTVSAAIHLQVLNPLLAVTRVMDYRRSTGQLVQAALREVVARTDLRSLLLDQGVVGDALGQFVDTRSEPWGIRTTAVDIREITLPASMQRAMERQSEILGDQQTQRLRAAAELEAAQRLAAAAAVLATQPYAVQLRFLQALTEIGAQGNATVVVVPLPTELVQPFIDLQGFATPPAAVQEPQPPQSPDPTIARRPTKRTSQQPFGDGDPAPRA